MKLFHQFDIQIIFNRSAVATGLNRCGVDDLSIMPVTGQRNIKSLQESYIDGPTEQQRMDLCPL